jgi:hypothetical protein
VESDADPPKADNPAHSDEPSEPSSWGDEHSAINSPSDTDPSNNKKHPLEWAIALMLFGTLVATGFAACYTRRQWITSTDTEHRQLRAYVGVEDHKISGIAIGERPHLEVVIKNFCQTPASEVSYWVASIIDTARKPSRLSAAPFGGEGVLFPGRQD